MKGKARFINLWHIIKYMESLKSKWTSYLLYECFNLDDKMAYGVTITRQENTFGQDSVPHAMAATA